MSGEGTLVYAAQGDEITVNSTYARTQAHADVNRLPNGNFVVTWVDADFNTTADRSIRSQLYTADGTPLGSETVVSAGNGYIQPTVTGLADGGYVVAWMGWGSINARVFDSTGAATGSVLTLVPHQAASSVSLPDITGLADGGFAISWEDTRSTGGDTTGSGVHIRAYDQTGTPTGADILVNVATAGNQADSAITALSGGGYVVTWTDRGAGWVVKAQIFDAASARVGSEFVVNNTIALSVESSVVALSNGNFAVAWYEWPGHHIQIFSATGVRIGSQIDVDSTLTGISVGPELAALSDGRLALAFTANTAPLSDGSGRGVFVQVIGADGQAVGGPLQVNSQANGDQIDPGIVGLADGSFVVTWTDLNGSGADDDQVMAQVFAPHWSVGITSGDGGDTAAVAAAENGTAVTIVAAANGIGAPIVYQITGGADAALFHIDPATGALTFLAAPDFEAPGSADGDNVYDVVVSAADGTTSDSQSLAVTVVNANEGLSIVSAATASVDENSTLAAVVLAEDIDGDTPDYFVAGGADAALFEFDAVTGQLRFVGAPDFEAPADADGDNVYDVIVGATDGEYFDYRSIAITVGNETAELGFAASALAISADENAPATALVVAISENGDPISYAIAGGADAAHFTIDAQTGALSMVGAPDFEAPGDADGDNVYDVLVSATDGSKTASQTVSVTIGNVDEGVKILSGGGADTVMLSLSENQAGVTTVAAVDLDGDTVSYAIAGGADAGLFAIDAVTGQLAFVAAPNFETPVDANGDGSYKVTVVASSGAFSATQSFSIAVLNVNEGIAITSGGGAAAASISVAENGTAVTTILASDPDGTAPSYSIVGGADAARFVINAQTGALRFAAVPDYEDPDDANGDNIYSVVVGASDGQLIDTQALTITVTDVNGRTINGTSAADTITPGSTNPSLRPTGEEDTIYGREGNDIIQGGAGNDWLNGGAGADRLTGGVGADQFVFSAVSESTASVRDVITDFVHSQGDVLALTAIDANSMASGNQAFAFIGTSAFSGAAGQLRYEMSGGNTLVSGDVNGDGVADFQVQLTGLMALTGSDFLL